MVSKPAAPTAVDGFDEGPVPTDTRGPNPMTGAATRLLERHNDGNPTSLTKVVASQAEGKALGNKAQAALRALEGSAEHSMRAVVREVEGEWTLTLFLAGRILRPRTAKDADNAVIDVNETISNGNTSAPAV